MGCSLGKYLSIHGVQVTGYYDRDTKAAEEAAQFIHNTDDYAERPEDSDAAPLSCKAYDTPGALIADSDVIFLTVPDGLIAPTFEEIRAYDIRGKFICHCSGSISSRDAFAGIGADGAYAYSVHPLFAVSDRYAAYRELAGAFFTLEGDPARLEDMSVWLAKAGLTVRIIDPSSKTKYHLAAVYASNLICGLIGEGSQLLQECGFGEEDALRALTPLIRGNVEHALKAGPVQALTGPVERGDVTTLQKHLAVCETEEDRQLYRLLSRRLVRLAKEKHPNRDYTELDKFLEF